MKVMGLCNLYSPAALDGLTSSRPIASTSFLGRYALIDFTLSNFSNSGIDEVGILVKNHPRSILKHLGSTNVWNVNTKRGYEAIMYNEKHAHNPSYHHDINNIIANDWIFYSAKPDLFVIAPSHIIYSLDFRLVIEAHLKSEAVMTVVYTNINNGKTEFIGGDEVIIEDGKMTKLTPNNGSKDHINVSLETYVISLANLKALIELAARTSSFFCLKDVVAHIIKNKSPVNSYLFNGYVAYFSSLAQYHRHSIELLRYETRRHLFKPEWPIYTISHDTPPAKYGEDAQVSHSFVANGARINGTVQNSVISRNVIIEKGAVITNSVILTDSKIGPGVKIDYVVIDKYASIDQVKNITGTEENPVYIKQGDRI